MSSPTLHCPRCALPLETLALTPDAALHHCARCRGAWFDQGALGRALGTSRDLGGAPPGELPLADPNAPTCPRCPGVCLLRVPYAVDSEVPPVDLCPYCEGVWTSLPALARMRAWVAHRRDIGVHDVAPPSKTSSTATTPAVESSPAVSSMVAPFLDGEGRASLTFLQLAASVPVALMVVFVLRSVTLGRILMQGVRVSLHELGHAVTAWACGWMAVPLPVGLTVFSGARSVWVHLTVLALSGLGARACARRALWPLALGFVLYALVALVCTWALDNAHQHMLVVWGGSAGEVALGALLMAVSLMDIPVWRGWARVRWVLLALGACVFVDASLFWRAAAQDWELIPWDAALAEEGDMSVLHTRYGWDERKLTGRYVTLSWGCLAALLFAWATALLRRRGEARSALRRR